ncbi:MAG: DUF1559 domain-containing protein [Planctomycetia bacterium]|nr:DUF1559 domain-containing protein [Planctomycetia bacterium]
MNQKYPYPISEKTSEIGSHFPIPRMDAADVPTREKNKIGSMITFFIIASFLVFLGLSMLMALLFPALNSSRESSRQVKCTVNIQKMLFACSSYESSQGTLPPGGWGTLWAGDPNCAPGTTQPGGWAYAILPYMERSDVYEMGKNSDTLREDLMSAQRTPIPNFYCPSRRSGVARPSESVFYNSGRPGMMGKIDYAGNAGDGKNITEFLNGEGMNQFSEETWQKQPFIGPFPGWEEKNTMVSNGVFQRRFGVKLDEISDGVSYTYMLGEKYLYANAYDTGTARGDDQGWDVGFDDDILRFVKHENPVFVHPTQDTKDNTEPVFAFGGPHPNSFLMGMCDYSVSYIHFGISMEIFEAWGIRNDSWKLERKSLSEIEVQ